MAELRPQVLDALQTIYDPEIPVNIAELGLIYDVLVDADAQVGIRMTLTAPACPAAQILPGEVREKASKVRASAAPRSRSSGIRPGPRTGCPRPRNCSSDCSRLQALDSRL